MKKTFCVILSILLMLSLLPITFAKNSTETIKLTIESMEVTAGETGEFDVRFTLSNAPEIKSFCLTQLAFDKTKVKLVKGEVKTVTPAVSQVMPNGNAIVAYSQNTNVNGVILTYTFRILDNTFTGELVMSADFAAKTKPANGKETSVDGIKVADGKIIVKEKHQHNFSLKIKNAAALRSKETCTSDAEYYYICSCGEISKTDFYVDSGSMLSHVAAKTQKENIKEATCTTAGSYEEVAYCALCGKAFSKELKILPALGHDEIAHEAKAATCTEKGYKAYVTCSRCDYTTFEETPALGHKEEKISAVAPTCTKTGLTEGKRCSRCGTVLVQQKEVGKVAHKWDGGNVTKNAAVGVKGIKTFTCTVCRATRTEEIPALPKPQFKKGDVDLNGSISVADARLALRAAVGLDKLSGNAFLAADADGNGSISVADARMILRVAVGLEKFDD